MPELPEVETVKRSLEKLYLNKTISHVEVLLPRMILSDVNEFTNILQGATFTSFSRIGKYLLLGFDNGYTLVSHLRMEGKYIKRTKDENITNHTRVVFHLTDSNKMCYDDSRSFGVMILAKNSDVLSLKEISKLGPEPFNTNIDYLYSCLSKSKQEIKSDLLNQEIMTGLGNIYVDEVLFKSKINPYRISNTLSKEEVQLILDNSIIVLNHAIELGGSTVSSYHPEKGVDGRFQNELNVYGRSNMHCLNCNSILRKGRLNGRGTTYCPICQKVCISLGITGKIASGKSTVLSLLKDKGYKIFSSDLEVARLYTLENLKKKLVDLFGQNILDSNSNVSKDYIKKMISTDLCKKKKLENLIHPLVKDSIIKFINKNKNEKLVIIEVPLMFEQKIYTLFDYVVGIDCSLNTQVKHLQNRGSNTIQTDLLINKSNQFDKNIDKCDFIINNDGDLNDLNNQINALLNKILE